MGTMRYGECVGILGILQLDVVLAAAAAVAVVVLQCCYHMTLPRQHQLRLQEQLMQLLFVNTNQLQRHLSIRTRSLIGPFSAVPSHHVTR